jgi:leucyl-tRNA synthetase
MIAKLMELANLLMRYRGSPVAGTPEWDEAVRLALLMLSPAAPHITEELWSRRLATAKAPWSSIHTESWPEVDASAVVEATREVPVQVNGKVRDRITVAANTSQDELERVVLASERIQAVLAGREPLRIIHAGGGRLVNIVVADGG